MYARAYRLHKAASARGAPATATLDTIDAPGALDASSTLLLREESRAALEAALDAHAMNESFCDNELVRVFCGAAATAHEPAPRAGGGRDTDVVEKGSDRRSGSSPCPAHGAPVTRAALERAWRTIDAHFTIVGVTERLDEARTVFACAARTMFIIKTPPYTPPPPPPAPPPPP